MFDISNKDNIGADTLNSSSSELLIPMILNERPMIEIPIYSFAYRNLVSLHFEEGCLVKKVGPYAFSNCCSLKFIIFPDSLTNIETGAFINCKSLESIDIKPNTSLETIGNKAFMNCGSLKSFSCPKSLRSIGEQAFYGCKRLKIDDLCETSIKEIGKNAFCLTKTKNLVFPKSFVPDFENLFYLKNVQLNCESKLFSIDGCGIVYCNKNRGICFVPRELKSATIREGIEHLNRRSFFQSDIRMQALPSSIQEIHEDACCGIKWKIVRFASCSQLKIIHPGAFKGCYVKKVIFPKSLKFIGKHAFLDCNFLRLIHFPLDSELEIIGFEAFRDTIVKKLELPSHVINLEPGAFAHMKYLTEISINSEKYISKNGIVFSESGNRIVYAVPNKLNVEIPADVQIIEDFSFVDSIVQEIKIPKSVRKIGKFTFANSKLRNISFEEGSNLEEIEEGAFKETSIKFLDLPSSITKLSKGAFYEMYELTSIKISSQNYYTDSLGVVFSVSPRGIVFVPRNNRFHSIPEDVEEIFDYAIGMNQYIQSIRIPSSVKYLGNYSLSCCPMLEKVSFDQNSKIKILNIGIFFKNAIKSIHIPQSVEIMNDSLLGCNSLEEIHFHRKSMLRIINENLSRRRTMKNIYIPRRLLPLFVEFDLGNAKLQIFD